MRDDDFPWNRLRIRSTSRPQSKAEGRRGPEEPRSRGPRVQAAAEGEATRRQKYSGERPYTPDRKYFASTVKGGGPAGTGGATITGATGAGSGGGGGNSATKIFR